MDARGTGKVIGARLGPLPLLLCLGALGCGEGRLEAVSAGDGDGAAPVHDGGGWDGDAVSGRDAVDQDPVPVDGGVRDRGADDVPREDAATARDARVDGWPEPDAADEDGGHGVDAADAAPPADARPVHPDALPPTDAMVQDGPIDAMVQDGPTDAMVQDGPPDAMVAPHDAVVDDGPPDAVVDAEPPDAVVDDDPPDAAPLVPCPLYDEPRETGDVLDREVREASGIAESRRNPGVLWTHNDSGDRARLFALTIEGEPLGVFELEGVRATDWEDLAIGPGPDPDLSYLYVGDVGDNFRRRANIRVHRVAEPEVVRQPEPPVVRLAGVETFTLVYPDAPHNSETIMVDPVTGDLYVVVKSGDGDSPVFRAAAPLSAEGDIRLERVAPLTFGEPPLRGNRSTTGGDISPSGDAILIRTYSNAFLWRRSRGATVAEALATAPCPVPLARDGQGEAIGFAADGSGYYTVAEGVNAPVYFYRRR